MDKIQLNATKRTVTGRKVKKLRKDGIVPANLYGKKIKSQALAVNEKEFKTVFDKAGETSLVELMLDSKVHPVLVHNVSYHPVTSFPLHVDFFQVDLHEKVQTKVPLSFVGESPAVADKLGVILNIISEIEIEALPTDLPEKLELDMSSLKAVNDALKVSDLKVSDKIKILTDAGLEIIKIAPLVSKEAEKLVKEEAEAKAAQAAGAAAEAVSLEGAPAEKTTPETQVPPPSSQTPSEPKKE